ncbi:MAG: hypothetical protein IKA79_09295 [Lentisphaeria bacterium]|nr:hypothetical protein [Lentisphaeria bacterium]
MKENNMEYIIIAQSGYIPELKISVRKDQHFKIGHPFAKALLPYSTTPHLLSDLTTGTAGTLPQQTEPEQSGGQPLTRKEEEELRKMAKEAGFKQWKNMKIENIIKKLEDLNNE